VEVAMSVHGPSHRLRRTPARQLSGVDRTNGEGTANDANEPKR
jgi:hypothetical protein